MTHSPTHRSRPEPAGPDWDATLDDLETSLLAWEAWLADASVEPPEQWQPPIGLPPLGPSHGERAGALHRRYQQLTTAAAGRLEQVRRERGQVSAPRAAPGYASAPQSAYLDLEA